MKRILMRSTSVFALAFALVAGACSEAGNGPMAPSLQASGEASFAKGGKPGPAPVDSIGGGEVSTQSDYGLGWP